MLVEAQAARPDSTQALWPTKALKQQLAQLAKPVLADYRPEFRVWSAYPEKSAHYYFPTEEGACYWLLGSAGPGVQDVDMYLRDRDDHTVKEDRDSSPDMKLHFCTERGRAGQFHVELKLKKGQGEVAMQVYKRHAAMKQPLEQPSAAPSEQPKPVANTTSPTPARKPASENKPAPPEPKKDMVKWPPAPRKHA